jgi:very-short-patch-repair endonuclease
MARLRREGDAVSLSELQRRLVFSLLRPAARLGRHLRLPLTTLEELCRLAYFEEVRAHGGATQAEAARLFDRSLRTVASLEKAYRADFLAPEREVEMTRRVEAALERGARTAAQVAQRLRIDPSDAERALDALVAAGRAQVDAGAEPRRFRVEHRFVSLYSDDLKARIDGLNHQLDVIVDSVRARFAGDVRPAVARTLSFVAGAAAMRELADELVRTLRRRCSEIEEDALAQGGGERYAVTFALAPTGEDDT